MLLRKAGTTEFQRILEIQKRAYLSEASLYGDSTIAPLHETETDLRSDSQSALILVAVLDGEVVGSVRAMRTGDTALISRLSVAPEYQGRKIGQALLGAIEAACEGCRRFELFTGHKSEMNQHIYRKNGYLWERDQEINESLSLFWMAKTVPG